MRIVSFNNTIRRCPLRFGTFEVAVWNKIVGKLSKIVGTIRVQNALISHCAPNVDTATRTIDCGFQNLQVEPCAFRQGENAGVHAILTLSHLHAGGSLPRVGLTPVTENPYRAIFSHRLVGDGYRKATIRRAYAFGMVMYWV